jgi:hypothetical protein
VHGIYADGETKRIGLVRLKATRGDGHSVNAERPKSEAYDSIARAISSWYGRLVYNSIDLE